MQLKDKTILVSGGAGFIGSHLVDALTGANVRILDDLSTGTRDNIVSHQGSHLEWIQGDIRDANLVDRAMQGVDVVFHLACRGVRHSIGNPKESHEVNASGTLELLRAARKYNVERFVHVSSSEVYGTARTVPMDENHPCFPETVYGAAKLAGECYARAYFRTYGLPVVVVRPFNNFGPRSHFEGESGEVIPRFCVWALNGMPPVIFGDGSQTRDFLYVEDTADWLRVIAESERAIGKTINLGSGVEVSVRTLAQVVYELGNRSDIAPRFLEPRPGDVHRLIADTTVAKQMFGFQPLTTLRDGIDRLMQSLHQMSEIPASFLSHVQDCNWVLSKS
jgi:UDP-glucose 4-epimerase